MNNKKGKVVIVGAGMGGLTASAYLCKENYDVLLLEKNDRTGGLVHTFSREGFSFDTGPRAFVNSGMVKPILKDLGIEWETMENVISLAIEDQMFRVDSMDSLNDYKQTLINLYPEDADDIEKIGKSIQKLSEYTKTLYAFDNPYFVDYMSDKKFVLTKLLPWTFKLLYTLRKFKQFNMPMEEFLGDLTDNESLKDILTQFFFRKTPTYFALGYFHVWLDYFYPKGGTGVLPKLLHEKILEGGGKFKLNTTIKEVIPSKSKVTDSDGNIYEYDHLIWAADLKTLYKGLNTIGLDENVTKKIAAQSEMIFSSKPAESSFILYLAVDRPLSYFREKGGEHAFYTPSRKGLGKTNRETKEELIEDFEKKSKEEVFAWLNDFCNLNTFEVSIPALRDSTLAPDGKTGIMISCLFDYDVVDKINGAGWIDEFKNEMENQIIKIFSKSFYQDFEKDILFKFSTTPLTIRKTVGSTGGAIVGWSFETKSPVFNELKDMPKSAQTPIPNVFQAGQWAYAPAGVPIAMLTGWHATQEIIRNQGKNK
ncbi:NAD(P)/FAD-dependent oxidoreductase [Alkalibacter rhizosphaerae]|uniref:NAD(P)/FAD-dependent oxidoreductase n=1 Tax=Alkalibacter rhizosphaerae TaxID=2815577 RepID=A0A974XIU1_9FIRM|nr:NAD(P)/FAD-dependent oxidoreductase [Alkalibacter rhizosphaerae]QSX09500.1 NAD(P)/FAD-dependent oxidoreductase [Alkalibacter rhizosphaerae]